MTTATITAAITTAVTVAPPPRTSSYLREWVQLVGNFLERTGGSRGRDGEVGSYLNPGRAVRDVGGGGGRWNGTDIVGGWDMQEHMVKP